MTGPGPAAAAHPIRVVAMPAAITIANAGQVRDRLAAAAALPHVTTVVADLTRTMSCDGEGAYSLAQAHRDAAAYEVDLRLAALSAEVLLVFARLGLEALLPLYPSVSAAIAAGPGPAPPSGTAGDSAHHPDE
jgi:anti-anti-sigma regulatory factor